jgi:hypothetical protein
MGRGKITLLERGSKKHSISIGWEKIMQQKKTLLEKEHKCSKGKKKALQGHGKKKPFQGQGEENHSVKAYKKVTQGQEVTKSIPRGGRHQGLWKAQKII